MCLLIWNDTLKYVILYYGHHIIFMRISKDNIIIIDLCLGIYTLYILLARFRQMIRL